MLYAAASKTKKDREQLCFAVFLGTIKRAFKAAACVLMLRGLIKTFFGAKRAGRRGKKRACLLCLTSGGVLRCLYRPAPESFDIKFYYTIKYTRLFVLRQTR